LGSLSGGHVQRPEYINAGKYPQPTSLGGRWDIDSGDFGVRCVVGIDLGHAPSVLELANLQAVDALIDDGDLATGIFQGFDRNRRGYLLVE
jgi:hypothetical protein